MTQLSRRPGIWRGTLAGAALVLACAACSSGGSSAQGGSDQPTQTVEAFMHALGAKDPDAACAQVSTGGKRLADTALSDCKEGLQKVLAEVSDPSEFTKLSSATVTGATINGDKATVTAAQISNVPAGYQNDVDLVKLDGRWYIDSKQ